MDGDNGDNIVKPTVWLTTIKASKSLLHIAAEININISILMLCVCALYAHTHTSMFIGTKLFFLPLLRALISWQQNQILIVRSVYTIVK